MKPLHAVLAVAFVVCGGLLIFGRHDAPDQVVEASPRAAAAARTAAPAGRGTDATSAANPDNGALVAVGALRSRKELFGSAGGGHHALFGSQTWAPALPSVAPAGAQVPPLPSAPIAPTLPFTYIGKQASDGAWEVYLAHGDETVIVHDKSVIDATYRVDSIKPPVLTLTYLPLKLVQTIDIGSAD
ncbi:hypothetical protein [Paraburkholderia sp. SOS3]|uniref:hypothetical protein n=1 Tax=Paraburkholderia sp. SOS3 TaxID=1926494 RepID=UPI0009476886|nr:hypothetical protein [Paraburkholderia sp. SOS3]APR39554.1 hypothetical protein BTO02_30435 [Paraburkholderia sp. SOS3]